ncbi:MAG: NMD3-related protein [Candidatus Aenigmarchaeota archaeon]|jgi:NMD protein affecting ribosome stability and mRNA decay|nr:NMD3-related protein [Candidatus Aenigmarchaeota archaeon]
MICPRCGRNVDKFYDNLCLECFIDRLEIQKINIRRCKVCGRYFVSNKSFDSRENAIDFYVKKFLSKKHGEIVNLLPTNKIEIFEKQFFCSYCKKFVSRKIEAILQLRGKNVEYIVEKYGLVGKPVRGGFDINFSFKRYAYELINKLRKKYKLSMKVSRKLMGLREGKKVYRDTILVRINGKKV